MDEPTHQIVLSWCCAVTSVLNSGEILLTFGLSSARIRPFMGIPLRQCYGYPISDVKHRGFEQMICAVRNVPTDQYNQNSAACVTRMSEYV